MSTDKDIQKRHIRNDINECIARSTKALGFLDKGEYEKAEDEMEEVQCTADFVTSELQTLEPEEEKKEEKDSSGVGAMPQPQSSPPEPISAPVGSPE